METKQVQKTAIARGVNLPISTKYSVAICKFIKNKTVDEAIEDLNDVLKQKKAIPMKGEYAHKKNIGSGKYPLNATKYFIKLLKNLKGNCTAKEIEKPIITEAIANKGLRPRARFGSWRRKRTHVKLVAKEKWKKEKQ